MYTIAIGRYNGLTFFMMMMNDVMMMKYDDVEQRLTQRVPNTVD